MLNETMDFWIVFPSFESERFDISQLNVLFFEHFRNQVLFEGPTNNMPTLICRCLQALAEALKINASVTDISLSNNQIGAEGAKAWRVVGYAESLNAAACHDVMFLTSCDSEKFGWFAADGAPTRFNSCCYDWTIIPRINLEFHHSARIESCPICCTVLSAGD